MNRAYTIGIAGLLTLVAACATPDRNVTSVKTLRSDSVPCSCENQSPGLCQRDLLWRSGDSKHGCDVTITFHGTEDCPAYLEYVTPREDPWEGKVTVPWTPVPGSTNSYIVTMPKTFHPKKTSPVGAAGVTKTLQDVTDVWLVCGDHDHPHDGRCAYTIDAIDCSRSSGEVYPATTNATALASAHVACGAGKQVVWTAPKVGNETAVCTVTVLLKGSAKCWASLWAYDALGNTSDLQMSGERPFFVTLYNVAKLTLDCWSTQPSEGECSIEIVQTDCPRSPD